MSAEVKCKALVWKRDSSFRGGQSVQCTRAAKVDGYCTQHHPDTIKARDLKSRQEYEAKWAAESARRRLNDAAPDLLAALKRVGCQDAGSCGPTEPDGLCFVCAAIAKAEGREPTRKPTEQERVAEAKAKHEDAMLERRRGL